MANLGQTRKTRTRLTQTKCLEAIAGSGGIMTTICTKLGVTWHTANKYIKNNVKLQEAVELELEVILDVAEVHLYEHAVERAEPWAIKYLLSTKGKNRGYTTGTDLTSKGEAVSSGTLVILPNNNRDKESGEIERGDIRD